MQWGDRAVPAARRGARLGALVTTVVAVLAVVTTGTAVGPAADARAMVRVSPLLKANGFADPSVARYGGGYVAVSTGVGAPMATANSPTGPWRMRGPAMVRLPSWTSSPVVWASDIVQSRHRWVLYYSAPVLGLGPEGRCIGVAVSRTALGPFRSTSRRPLVCPDRARARRADDRMHRRGRRLPRTGVIDPSGFRARNGHRYLLYKTQGLPSTIRIVRLSRSGTRVRRHARSHQLLRGRGIIENPVLLQRRDHFVLVTSEGYFGGCRYRTTWRRSDRLGGWQHARAHVLLRRARLGLCGPGGADVVVRDRGRPLLFFHGWTCGGTRSPCPRGFHIGRPSGRLAHRSLYAAHLTWTRHGTPRVRGFLRPR